MKKVLVLLMVLLFAGSFLFAAGSSEKATTDKAITIKVQTMHSWKVGTNSSGKT